jgi:hypothetical protein
MAKKNQGLQEAILWGALGYLAGKRSNRDLLADGCSHHVTIDIVGKIDRSKVDTEVNGFLEVGHPQPSSSSEYLPMETVIAVILQELDAPAQERLMLRIRKAWEEQGELQAGPALTERVKAWLKTLKRSIATQRRGNLIFRIQE